MTGRLDERSAVVTGGASGIGRAVVRRFLAAGARVTVVDRDIVQLRAMEVEGNGRVATVAGDVRDRATHDQAIDTTIERWGSLDTYVANAGIYDYLRPVEAMDGPTLAALMTEVYEVNVVGALVGVQAALPYLRETGGSVIFTASSSSTYAGGGGVAYVAAKHALLGAMRQLAYELQPDVRVNAVAPGGTVTELAGSAALGHGDRHLAASPRLLGAMATGIPLGFVAEPDDHAALYELLASDDARFITGTVLASDGGLAVPVRPRPPATDQKAKG
ncbi:MAG: 3-(cis-5,6-dihydroxycyclohexa,3-dien-yl)propanoate dehydrogenase [Actinomycetia bacterium]|nr:3-(cis-5,6-dihydroxycyclohexa,3-dien-yl)propanoate dehydrogenase [Actinomycetes bacterium]